VGELCRGGFARDDAARASSDGEDAKTKAEIFPALRTCMASGLGSQATKSLAHRNIVPAITNLQI